MTQVQHRDDLPLCPTCQRSDYLMRWDTSRTDWLCAKCQKMYWDSEMIHPVEADGGWLAPDDPGPVGAAVLALACVLLALGVTWLLFAV